MLIPSGIAKGYIGDRMTELLEAGGATSAIINLGGNVICIGAKDNSSEPDEGAFVIGVEAPYTDRTEIAGKIKARDMTLVTSGVYERKIEVDGKLYHHFFMAMCSQKPVDPKARHMINDSSDK